MADIEKVITGLELCTHISQDGCLMLCPYKDEQDETYPGFCEEVLKQDALALLKEQEAVEPKEIVDEHFPIGDFRRTIGWLCGKCGEELMGAENYCSNCGQAVKWE